MMEKLNNKIYSLFEDGLLYPVSLKAPTGKAKVVFENDVTSNLVKIVKYDDIDFSDNNQDAKIKFSVDEIDKEESYKSLSKEEQIYQRKNEEYKQIISQLSPAYLSMSEFYVGPNLPRDHESTFLDSKEDKV